MDAQLAMVFPGQGSQSLKMLAELAAMYPRIQQTFAAASDVLSYDLWHLTQEGPLEQLNQTEYTQPALLAADIALWRIWQELAGPVPSLLAGHSLGEYSALVAAGSLEFAVAIDLVAKRGRFMQQATAPGVGAMAAIVGLTDDQLVAVCEAARQPQEVLSPANFNSIGQTVIAGHTTSVENALKLAKEQGAKLVKLIPISVPAHCDLMAPAGIALADCLAAISIRPPQIPVLHNHDVRVHTDTDEIRNALVLQLTQPVPWVEIILAMQRQGVTKIIECGPGQVLTGLNKRITPAVVTYPIAKPDQLVEAMAVVASIS